MSKKFLTYTYRVYPNKRQRELLNLTFRSCREVYNILLKETIEIYKRFRVYIEDCILLKKEAEEMDFFNKNKTRKISQIRKLNKTYGKVDSLALVNEQKNVVNAFERYFSGTSNFPKYKRRVDKNSYTTSNVNDNVRMEGNKIRVPKIGFIKAKIHRNLPYCSIIKKAVVKEDKNNKYYIGLVIEVEDGPTNKVKNKIVGLDFKVGDVFVSSAGYIPAYTKPYRNSLEKLKKLEKLLGKKLKFSKNYWKTVRKIRKLHKIIVAKRRDFLHKLSSELADTNKYIIIETLSLIEISKKLTNGINVYDTSYDIFINMLKYKTNGMLIYVDKWFPSSKLCSKCGNRKKKLKLSQRIYRCHRCGQVIDRDLNAAINIYKEGVRMMKIK